MRVSAGSSNVSGIACVQLFLVAVSLALAGCTAPERELARDVPDYVTLTNGGHPDDPLEPSGPAERHEHGLINTLEQRHGRPLQIVQLSGGGQNGAFAAGVLVGWREIGTRPRFDIVTGISVGGLISTFAFLGEPEDDATLEQIFTSVQRDDIYVPRSKLAVAFGGSALNDSAPLAALIERHVTDEVVARVGRGERDDRRLLIGALNLEYRQLWVFDMTALAASDAPDRADTYRKVLLAAASPPVMFPPVEIGGYLYADGGVRDRLLVVGLGRESPPEERRWEEPGDVWAIFNDKAASWPRSVREDLKGMVSSSLQSMLTANMETTVVRAYGATLAHGYDFNLHIIPFEFKLGPDPMAFDQEEMRTLFQLGRALGREPSTWRSKPKPRETNSQWIIDAIGRIAAPRPE